MIARNGINMGVVVSNITTGAFSSILGGSGNNVGGLNNVFIAGIGITAVAPNTFHVECLNAVNTPAYVPGGYPVNTLTFWALPAPALGLPAGTKIAILV